MSLIRAATSDDAEEISDLFWQSFRDGAKGKTEELSAYLKTLYLNPDAAPGINSLVHEDGGRVTGFLGVYPVPMLFKQRPVIAAVCGSVAVLDPQKDPMAGARLIKSFLNGPQDLSFSETANKISYALWTGSGGSALLDYSMKWHRPIFPLGYALQMASERSSFVRRLLPVMRPVAKLFDRFGQAPTSRTTDTSSSVDTAISGVTETVDREEFVSLYPEMTRHFDPRPAIDRDQLAAMLIDAQQKPALGDLFLKKVVAKNGRPVGAIAYHYRAGGVMHILQMLAHRKAESEVLDALIEHARERGAVGIIGRTQPHFLLAMQGRKIYFLVHDWTVVHAKDKDLVAAYLSGKGFVNGLVGEYWNRLNNGI